MNLDTGDIILFDGQSCISNFIECLGQSSYSHVGMIIKNPSFLRSGLPDGLYMIESNPNGGIDAEDGMTKYGVQLRLLEDIVHENPPGTMYYRKVAATRDEHFYKTLTEVHREVYNKPYDFHPYHWILAKYNMIVETDIQQNTKDRFWCSALIAFIFDKLDLVKDVNWTLIAPREFSSHGKLLTFLCEVGDETPLSIDNMF